MFVIIEIVEWKLFRTWFNRWQCNNETARGWESVQLKEINRPVCDISKIVHLLHIRMWNSTVWLLMLMYKVGVCYTMNVGRHILLKLKCVSMCMCMCVYVSLNNPAHNLAGSQRPWAGCYHGNLTASIFLAHTFPLNSRPMTDQPTGKSGLLKAHAWVACLCMCVHVLYEHDTDQKSYIISLLHADAS